MNTIGDRLKFARKNKGVTQKAAGDFVELSAQQISMIENNKSQTGNDTLSKLGELYGVSLDWIMGKSEDNQSASGQEVDEDFDRWIQIYLQMSPEERSKLIDDAEVVAQIIKAKKKKATD